MRLMKCNPLVAKDQSGCKSRYSIVKRVVVVVMRVRGRCRFGGGAADLVASWRTACSSSKGDGIPPSSPFI